MRLLLGRQARTPESPCLTNLLGEPNEKGRTGYGPVRPFSFAGVTAVISQPLEENRGAVRRDGVPTLVELSIGEKAYQGWILNRSTTGLCVATRALVGPGSTIMVRGLQYSEPGPWVTLRVQNCSQDGDDCLVLGCQFVGSQPWGVLLHFG